MGGRLDAEIRVFKDFSDANRAIAGRIVEMTEESARDDGKRFSVVLAGGGTPRGLYRVLADEFAERIDWARIDLFWGDERYVPHDDPQSNFRMAREALIDHVAISAGNVFPMPTDFPDPMAAAREYDETLRSYFSDREPSFDLVLLGIGGDGHTASLFPESPAISELDHWVAPVTASAEPGRRLTLTYLILNAAENIFFLARGSTKSAAIREAVTGPADPSRCPASGIDPKSGRLIWWLDADAARKL